MATEFVGQVKSHGEFVRINIRLDNTNLEPVGCDAWARIGGRVIVGRGRGRSGDEAFESAASEIMRKVRAYDDQGTQYPF